MFHVLPPGHELTSGVHAHGKETQFQYKGRQSVPVCQKYLEYALTQKAMAARGAPFSGRRNIGRRKRQPD
jgi:hypothetical protein